MKHLQPCCRVTRLGSTIVKPKINAYGRVKLASSTDDRGSLVTIVSDKWVCASLQPACERNRGWRPTTVRESQAPTCTENLCDVTYGRGLLQQIETAQGRGVWCPQWNKAFVAVSLITRVVGMTDSLESWHLSVLPEFDAW